MTFDRARVVETFGVSRETVNRLDALVEHVNKWQRAINLVAESTLPHIWHRHIADSAQFFAHAPLSARRWADLGSGAGFPGLVVAAMAAQANPLLHVTLVESDSRKAAFIADAARKMEINVSVAACRVESMSHDPGFDVISARALAPLPRLMAMAKPLLSPIGTMIFAKGGKAEAEIEALDAIDREKLSRVVSVTHPDASLLKWA